ncbi:porin family protein [Vibrio lamellibrachiae]|uniref:outer membrane beta-barrel protein n=1 Tax=Vibrio lamellibrachiae TaxID=2910253 RepID=UPI003D0D075C
MNKTLLALTITTLAAPSAMATEYFVGGGLGYHTTKAEIANNGHGYTGKNSGLALHIRGGAYITENHRLTGTANFVLNDEVYAESTPGLSGSDYTIDFKQTEFLMSYDYIHSISSDFSVFGGATAGMVKNTLKEEERYYNFPYLSYSVEESKSDFTYGLQVGAQYKLTNDLSADLQYRHMFESFSYTEGNYKESISNHGEFTISLDYRF